MVRQATETAVSASISTPVLPSSLAVAVTRRPGSAASGSMSTVIFVKRQRMAERDQLVRLLRRHDAGDARRRRSRRPSWRCRRGSDPASPRAMTTAPLAVAVRAVTALSPTSTMSAVPSAARCVSRALIRPPRAFSRASSARVAAATSACRIRLSPTRIARTPARREPRDIGRREDAALADDEPIGGNERRQALRRRRASSRMS